MIFISACFSDAILLDKALGEIKNKIRVKNVLINEGSDDSELPVNYPIRPQYKDSLVTDYLEGLPHILSGGAITNSFYEPKKDSQAWLAFLTDDKNERTAKSIILNYRGYNIKVGH